MPTMHRLLKSTLDPLLRRLDRRIDARVAAAVEAIATKDQQPPADRSTRRLWVPPIDLVTTGAAAPFMQYAICTAADYTHPEFARICDALHVRLKFIRKLWEYVFIVHHLEQAGVLVEGARGLVFGVGAEPLPAYFAGLGCEIVATDAPIEVADRGGWTEHRHSDAVDAMTNNGICDPGDFRRRVRHRFVDMNAIPDDLDGFDFCWSACCFEHLGSLKYGLEFVINSVERCLRSGGIAVHTTEYNLSSNDATLEVPNLSIYRRRDLEWLIDDLRGRGHTVNDLTIAPDASYLDQYVDVRPFSDELHLKLELASYTTTSVGLVVRKSETVDSPQKAG
jgi:SAM-dependent methyltransferase